MKKGKKRVFFILIPVLILAIATYLLFFYTEFQSKKILQLENEISNLKEVSTPIRFKILKKSENYTEIAIKFYDLDDNVVARHDLEIEGSVVSFDFLLVPVGDKFLAFPNKIFSEKIAPKDGISLIEFYYKKDFPAVLYSKNSTSDFNEGVAELFEMIKKEEFDELAGIFGSGIQDIKNINQFETGSVYSIVVHTKGGVEIVRE